MNKGQKTREMILERSAPLFNQQGYFGSPLSAIMKVTGLEKGGIYNHFQSKEQLALDAFDYAVAKVRQRMQALLAGKRHAVERLYAICTFFEELVESPPVAGGCPLLNTAIEADDAYPLLRDRARAAMDEWRGTIRRIVTKGIERHEIRPEADAETVASVMISVLEGAVMLSKLYSDTVHIHRAVSHLRRYIETELQ
ncbi:MAG TPA: TetR/AcrR family transcriptional regulator [Ktedonobacteraceae bacterium]|nr:TetR/AcrR family transcriptional regulator [Ktedonobacteraceae bacterium]